MSAVDELIGHSITVHRSGTGLSLRCARGDWSTHVESGQSLVQLAAIANDHLLEQVALAELEAAKS